MIQGSAVVKASVFASLLLLIPPIVVTLDNDEMREKRGDGCLDLWGYAAFVLGAYAVLYLVAFLYLALRLHKKWDSFGIKTELRSTGIVALIVLVPWLAINVNAETEKNVNEQFPISTALLFFGVTWAFVHSTLVPLWRSISDSRAGEEPRRADSDEDLSSFHNLLAAEDGYQNFKNFLTSEFSVENILFWKDATQFKKKGETLLRREQELMVSSSSQRGGDSHQTAIHESYFALIEEAQTLFSMYIAPEAPLAINVHGTVRTRLYETLFQIQEAPDEQFREANALKSLTYLFEEADQIIYALMEKDSYARYKSSDYYREFVRARQAERRARDNFDRVM